MPKLEKNPRNTKQIEMVWEAIKDDSSHLTADQVYAKVRERLLPLVTAHDIEKSLPVLYWVLSVEKKA